MHKKLFCALRAENLNCNVVAMEDFQASCNGFLNFLGYDVCSRSFCQRFHQIL